MENSLETIILLNLNLKLHNSESTIFWRQGNFCRDFQCKRYYFNTCHTTYFQKDTDKYTIHFIPVRRKVLDKLHLGQPSYS